MTEKIMNLPKNYVPKDTEKYMNDKQLEFFRLKLLEMKEDAFKDSKSGFEILNDNNQITETHDDADMADKDTQQQLNLKRLDRNNKLLKQIDSALERVKNKTYGFCVITGEEIGIARLIARPIAKMTIDAQAEHEMRERFEEE